MVVQTTCKFCNRAGSALIDDACPVSDRQAWVKFYACDRCADFRAAVAKSRDAIDAVCAVWAMARVTGQRAEQNARTTVDTGLTELTQRLSTLVGRHYRMQAIWDRDLVEMLMERPAK